MGNVEQQDMGYRVNGRALLRERTLASQRGGELREESGVCPSLLWGGNKSETVETSV